MPSKMLFRDAGLALVPGRFARVFGYRQTSQGTGSHLWSGHSLFRKLSARRKDRCGVPGVSLPGWALCIRCSVANLRLWIWRLGTLGIPVWSSPRTLGAEIPSRWFEFLSWAALCALRLATIALLYLAVRVELRPGPRDGDRAAGWRALWLGGRIAASCAGAAPPLLVNKRQRRNGRCATQDNDRWHVHIVSNAVANRVNMNPR